MKEHYDVIIRDVGQKLIKEYETGRNIRCGINGPYDDPETRVRNLSHLVIITAIEIITFNNSRYLEVLNLMGKELLSLRDANGLYVIREKREKDICNGVIGHSWVNEALVYLYRVTNDYSYLNAADKISSFHAFEPNIGLWGRPQMGIDDRAIDYTLNHQLWYAASLCELNTVKKNSEYEKQILRFMDCLNRNMKLTTNGKIAHSIYSRIYISNKIKNYVKEVLNYIMEILKCPSMAYKEEGYHLFNIMALCRIAKIYPDHPFFKSKKFNRAIRYCNSDKLKKGLLNPNYQVDRSLHNEIVDMEEKDINIYGYPYNVPGFEIAFCSEVLEEKILLSVREYILNKQFDLTFSSENGFFGKKCHDSNTINYRVYEYYRYLEIKH